MNKYDYNKLVKQVDEHLSVKLKRNVCIRDFANARSHFDEWCDAKGYGEYDIEGKHRGSSKIWFAEFDKDVEQRPYQDFWHVLLRYLGGPYAIDNPCNRKICFAHMRRGYGDELNWVTDILDFGFKEVLGEDFNKLISIEIYW